MKNILLSVLMLLPFVAAAQKSYIITGKLSELDVPAKAYLVTLQNNVWKETDSAIIKNGKFRFTGTVKEPQTAIIAVKSSSGRKNDDLTFYLENSNITITAKEFIKNAIVSGSISDKENRALWALVTPLAEKIMKIQDDFSGDDHKAVEGKTLAEKKAAGDSIQSYVAQIKNIRLNFIESHPNSFIALYTFNNFILNGHFNPADVSPLYYKFSPQLQSSSLGKLAIDRILSAQKRGIGVKIIDFTQTDLDGNIFNITSLRGKYVFLDFWASWCYWCRAENPNVLKAYQKLKGMNLEIVSVSFDDKRSAWEGAVKDDKLPWLQVSDLKGMKARDGLAARLDIVSIPQNLLIDPDGIIIASNLRGEDLPSKLESFIKEQGH